MTPTENKLSSLLQSHGLSVTKPRLFVFNLLSGEKPLAMSELTNRAAGNIDRASLYRVIDVFESIGVIRRVNIGWKYKIELSDSFIDHHHHIACLNCGVIADIGGAELETFIKRIASDSAFTIVDHQIELQGYCKACNKTTSK